MEPGERLFRQEAGRLVAILTRLFGIGNLGLAEDVVQDAFCRALETWRFHGVPENPSAWLLTTARNRALEIFRREGTARRFAPELGRYLESEWTLASTVEEQLGAGAIQDDLLRMMFSCVHPRIPEETQVAMILHLLCGFGVGETAAAFLKKADAMEKRIGRAKKTLARSRRLFDLSGTADVAARLPAVLRALYLLFNEGYHGASAESAVRADLCAEARRLAALLLADARTATPAAHALASLFCFLAARLPGRVDAEGNLALFDRQDRSSWDGALVAEGRRLLDLSATGDELTPYHLEAAVAGLHAGAARPEDTDWNAIVGLYDRLMTIQPTPVVALNRAVAIAERDGPARGLAAIALIDDPGRLARYPFYHAALGELERRLARPARARAHLRTALSLARNPMEKRFLEGRLRECAGGRPG
jgi:predicted RNA polymerase sigma factor